jgi:transglutaminase-like putative cysteine protease
MRIRVQHATTYEYESPAEGVVQVLRMTPSGHDGQRVAQWRVDVDVDGVLRERRDAFGNACQFFFADQPVTSLTVRVTGETQVRDTAGVIAGAREPFSPTIFLRTTALTEPDADLRAFAAESRGDGILARLHDLMGRLNAAMAFDTDATAVGTTGLEAFHRRRGVCQDYAHIFIAAARSLGIPARYVSGHLARTDTHAQDAAHAWAEAFAPDLGWVAFDAANGVCADDSYLRVATGLDYLDAAPMRGARRGGGEERLSVAVHARDAGLQRQD